MKFLPQVVAAVIATSEAFSPLSTRMPKVGKIASGFRTTSLFLTLGEAETETKIKEKSSRSNRTREESFVNDSPMAWMQQFLELAGIVEGQTIVYGPFAAGEVPVAQRTPEQEASQRREEAARNLQNIDMDERTRRANASKVMGVATALYAVWAALIGDQGDFAGHLLRFATFLPLEFAYGYRVSAQTGL